jgi:hypothetical protein
MCTKWIKNHEEVAKVKVDTAKNINKQMKNKSGNELDVFESMNQVLDEMRLNDEAIKFTLKDIDYIKNPLLRKRLEKKNSFNKSNSADNLLMPDK